jgi:Ca2+-binding RTX toxin-like protein
MVIHGTNNADTINAADGVTNGNDTIFGHEGNDTIYGLDGFDIIVGGAGADYMDGGSGTDTASYFDSNAGVMVSLLNGTGIGGYAQGDTLVDIENLNGSAFDDILVGNYGPNDLYGAAGHDILMGGNGDDDLDGGIGNDVLKGGGGGDILEGGVGIDTADYSDSEYGVFASLGSGTATPINWYHLARREGRGENDTLSNIENLTGSGHDDIVWGNDIRNVLSGRDGDDSLKGYGGNDTLEGGDGNDTLDGGVGVDTMIGGAGNDTYVVDNWFDVVTESGGQGMDVVRTSVSYTLTAGSDIEVLETTNQNGTAALSLGGNASGNQIVGNNGDNIINGGDGDDEMTGLGGQDSFLFNTALSEDFNIDVITDFNVADDTIRLDDDIFTSGLLAGNSVAGSQFVIGAAALDAGDRIMYNSATGAVYYDSDGTGAAAQIQFAQLSPGLALTNSDFLVVA